MARPNPLADNVGVAKTLKALIEGSDVSYAHKRILVERGYLDDSQKAITDAIKAAGRGRKKIEYTLTKQGKNLLNLSRNWKSMKEDNSVAA